MAFGVGLKGPCPVCGAEEHSCTPTGAPTGEVRGVIGAGMFTLAGAPMAVSRWRSRESVSERDPKTGLMVQKYGVGTPIPMAEALRQGVARLEDLSQADLAALAAHGVHPPQREPATVPEQPRQPSPDEAAGAQAAGKKRKGRDRPDEDRMVREAETVRK